MALEEHLVFVYGTLRNGASNAFRMEGARYEGSGLIKGRLYVVDWYPGFVRKGGDGWVEGELWSVAGEHLARLDEFEGEEYRRIRVEVRSQRSVVNESWGEVQDEWAGHKREAWVWEWLGSVDGLRVVPGGDWMDVERPRPPKVCTSMGCVVLPAIPIGSLFMLSWIQDKFWNSPSLLWIGKALLLLTPVFALVLARWGERRREGGEWLREAVIGVSIIWVTISALALIVWTVALVFG